MKYLLFSMLPFVVVAGVILSQSILSIKASAIGTRYWDDTPGKCDLASQYCGNQTIQSMVGQTRYVKKAGVLVRAYFTSPNPGQITISGANYCPKQANNPDGLETEDYYGSHSIGGDGEKITDFFVTNGTTYSVDKYGKYYDDGPAECSSSITFNNVIPVLDTDITEKELYYVDISAGNVKFPPSGSCDSDNICAGIQNSFYIRITGGDGYAIVQNPVDKPDSWYIKLFGGIDKLLGADGTMQRVNWKSGDDKFTDYIVRFGSDCKVTNQDSKPRYLMSYDLDGAGGQGAQPSGQPVRMDLKYIAPDGSTGYVTSRDKNGNPTGNPVAKDLMPTTVDNTTWISDAFYAKPGYRYEWHIKNVYYNNTIQVSIPFSGVYYFNTPSDPLCAPTISSTYAETTANDIAGITTNPANTPKTYTFKHYADVNPYVQSANGTVNWQVQTSNDGGITWANANGRSGKETVDRQQILGGVNSADALVNTGTWTVPSSGSAAYCERLLLSSPSPTSNVQTIQPNPSNPACIYYTNNGGPPSGNNTTPRPIEFMAQGGGEKKDEPEVQVNVEMGTILSANVKSGTNPKTNELGYTQIAKQQDPAQVYVQVTQQPAPYSENPRGQTRSKEANKNYAYAAFVSPGVCPAGYENTGSQCRIVVSYYCDNGWYGSGSTCYQDYTIYDWYCNDPNNHRLITKDAESPSVGCQTYKDYAICNDSSYTGGRWDYSAANPCPKTWTCTYPDKTDKFNDGKPLCEYRCDDGYGIGKGLTAAYSTSQKDPSGKYELQNGRDINCYQAWRVTVGCQITYTETGRGKWYRANGTIIPSGTVQSWPEVVTTDRYGNVSNYCVSPPGGYLGVQYEYGAVGDQGCAILRIMGVTDFVNSGNGPPLSPNNRPANNRSGAWSTAIGASAQQCWTSIGRPFVQFNNTDITTMACGRGTGGVNLYAYDEYGSSVEYAAYVAAGINSLRTNYNNGSQGLAFASDGSKTIGGGNFATKSDSDCNYYASLVNTKGTNAASHIKVYPSDITIDQNFVNSVVTTNGSYAIFAPNITVSGNISLPFNLSNNASNPNEIGAKILYLVSDKNISVNSNVSNIDAMLIADETINTCNGSANACENNLVVNGGLAAATIQFRRTGLSSLNCARPGHGSVCNQYQYPAEIVNYGAYYEVFTAPFQPVSGVDQGKYDSIKSVAPIF